MKWFQLDSDTDRHPNLRAIIRWGGNEAMGALFRTWCYVAKYGDYIDPVEGPRVGWGLDGTGRPFPLCDLAENCDWTEDKFRELMDIAAERGHIDAVLWASEIVMFPAMVKRADDYSQRLMRDHRARQNGDGLFDVGTKSDNVQTKSDKVSLQDKTIQDKYKRKRSRAGARLIPSPLFERFWQAYPPDHRAVKQAALQVWADLGFDERLDGEQFVTEVVLPGLQRFVNSVQWRDGIGIPHPSRWLKLERWDETPPQAADARPRRADAAPPSGSAGVVAGKGAKYAASSNVDDADEVAS